MSIILDGTTGITTPDLIDSSLTSGRVVYAGASGNLTGSTALTFDGAILGVNGISVGRGAGAIATNTAVGASALAANTTGNFNTAIGRNAGLGNTDGFRNTFVGQSAGTTNSSGYYLTAVGDDSLFSNTSGLNNTAFGKDSLFSNTTASSNTAVGYQAGYTQTTGGAGAGANTYLGYRAGYLATGYYNTFVGIQAGQNSTGNGNTFIGSTGTYASGQSMTSGNNNTIVGNFSGNNDSLDIRTASNYVVLSDGGGNRQITMKEGQTLALDSAVPNAGTGITFPATQSASSNANTLDDYEEGTWTPAMRASSSGTITMNGSFTSGKYTKVGRLVVCTASLYVSSVSSPTGNLFITGLPFTVLAPSSAGSFWGSGMTSSANNSIVIRIENTSTEALLQGFASGTVAAAAPWVQAATEMNVTLTYFV